MKAVFLATVVSLACTVAWGVETTKSSITVDPTKTRGAISPMLMGFNMSYYHDTDDAWADGTIARRLREIGTRLLRYPGGEETAYFHWEHPGVEGYHDVWETDPTVWRYVDPEAPLDDAHMDVDEYIAACRAIGAEPMIGINLESGLRHDRIDDSLAEAVRLIQHCVDNDYGVTYWYLDNEPYGRGAYVQMDWTEYRDLIAQFAPALKAVDPSIKIIANWRESGLGQWRELVRAAGEHIDIADIHCYWDWGHATHEKWLDQNPMRNASQWRQDGPTYTADIEMFHAMVADEGHPHIRVAVLEWNIAPNDEGNNPSAFQSALMQTEMMMQFADAGLDQACLWPLLWSIKNEAFVSMFNQTTFEATPAFQARQLIEPLLGGRLMSALATNPRTPALSVVSDDGGTVRVLVLNKSRAEMTVEVDPGIAASELHAMVLTTDEPAGDAGELHVLTGTRDGDSGRWTCTLPAESAARLTLISANRDE
jgi:hypothetical protein